MNDVERMVIERACERLMVDYAWAVDSGNASGIAALFTEDGVWQGNDGATMDGRAALLKSFTMREGMTRRASRHVITNQWVDVVSPDEAHGRAYLINYRYDSPDGVAPKPAPAGAPKYVGEYFLEYTRTSEGWRIRRLRFDLAFYRSSSRGKTEETGS